MDWMIAASWTTGDVGSLGDTSRSARAVSVGSGVPPA
jgi:hypothetical protein